MAWRCRFFTARRSQRGPSSPEMHPTHWLISTQAPTLEEGLKERNFAVTRVDAYTTAPAPWSPEDAAAAASADVVAVGSPSAARVWAARASVNVRAACVGATSADACVELGFGRDRVFAPAKPGLAGWAGAVRDAVAALA